MTSSSEDEEELTDVLRSVPENGSFAVFNTSLSDIEPKWLLCIGSGALNAAHSGQNEGQDVGSSQSGKKKVKNNDASLAKKDVEKKNGVKTDDLNKNKSDVDGSAHAIAEENKNHASLTDPNAQTGYESGAMVRVIKKKIRSKRCAPVKLDGSPSQKRQKINLNDDNEADKN